MWTNDCIKTEILFQQVLEHLNVLIHVKYLFISMSQYAHVQYAKNQLQVVHIFLYYTLVGVVHVQS